MGEEDAGDRLDRFIAAHLDVSRNQAQGWIGEDRVRVLMDGRDLHVKSSRSLNEGDVVRVDVPEVTSDPRVQPEEGPLTLVHVDDHLLVVDKPPGLAVHPGAGRPTGTLAHRLLHHHPELAGVGGEGRPGIVHRLDLDTSGVMVVARTQAAFRHLAEAFSERRVDKRYLAVVYGDPEERGEIDAPIGRHPHNRQQMTVRDRGREAQTRWRRLAGIGGAALLEVEILTGRTHQIRVHLKHANHPLVGDPMYGENRWKGLHGAQQAPLRDFPRPALHAWRLTLPHPAGGQEGKLARYEAAPPDDLAELWEKLSGRPLAEFLPPWDGEGEGEGDGDASAGDVTPDRGPTPNQA